MLRSGVGEVHLTHRMNWSILGAPDPVTPPVCGVMYACFLALLLVPAALGNLGLVMTQFWTRDQDWEDPDHRPRASVGSGGPRVGLKGPCSCFTLSLSLSDLALSLSVLPGAVYCAATGVQQVSAESTWCSVGAFLLVLLQTSALHSRMWMAVGQFSEIRHALSNGRLWTSFRIRVLLLLLWIYSGLYALLPVLGVGKFRFSAGRSLCGLSLQDEDVASRAVSLSWVTVSMAIPLMLTCALQGYVVHVARRQARRGTFRCNELHCFYVPAQAYERSSRALLISTGALILCWTPYLAVSLFEALSLDQAPVWVSQSSMFFVLSSSALSPGVTCLTQPQYRFAVRHIVSRLRQLLERPNPAPPAETATQITTTLPGAAHVPMTSHEIPTPS